MNLPKTINGIAPGFEPHFIKDYFKASRQTLLVVLANEDDCHRFVAQFLTLMPEGPLLYFPAWDCLPYDRVGPSRDVIGQRLDVLTTLLEAQQPYIIVTPCQSLMQRLCPRKVLRGQTWFLQLGDSFSLETLLHYLQEKGYARSQTVREPGEFAPRGNILDIYPLGVENPIRIDFFGNTIESFRWFDPIDQMTKGKVESLFLKPATEIFLTEETIALFRQRYRGASQGEVTPLYTAISAGQRYAGMEQWSPWFFETMETLEDYLPAPGPIFMHESCVDAIRTHWSVIYDYYQNRKTLPPGDFSPPYFPVTPESFYLSLREMEEKIQGANFFMLSPWAGTPTEECQALPCLLQGGSGINHLKEFKSYWESKGAKDPRPHFIGALSPGSRDRLAHLLEDHGINVVQQDTWTQGMKGILTLLPYPLERGFQCADFVLFTEEDLLGARLVRPASKRRKIDKFIFEASELTPGDLVVHQDHGIGRYEGLTTIQLAQKAHDCLHLSYEGGDKLFVPVENMEVLSKYGDESSTTPLDKLGAASWQNRKAKAKNRIREIAAYLLKTAAQRRLLPGVVLEPEPVSYGEFCARFPYAETPDQEEAIGDVLTDMASGRPMDRLVCGDVGFGKTEVALRASFVAVSNGKQVVVVVPTTLLCRQHFQTFEERFKHTPYKVAQLSRFTPASQRALIRQEVGQGKADILVATHSVFAQGTTFSDLGLVIVDEEQHFGVKQKEKLKELKPDVHLLTLTATPIPRTLQQSLTGVRDMSLISTPPVDRLSVRTFVTPYDSLVIREAILREYHRGGQIFYVCPRLQELESIKKAMEALVPEIHLVAAHGQLSPRVLETIISDFCNRKYHMLISTNIVESGIDIPNANTLIVHRADLFGLSQLYQLRGRVGRSKAQGYAYLTLPEKTPLSETARRRLEILQNLDKLGGGFTLAGHDMDIRGTGNLVGEEQSGHIREVGVELYQQMLQEAIMMERVKEEVGELPEDPWVPQINLGLSVMIPETYVEDLQLRLNLYRRIAHLATKEEIAAFSAEMIDRFGKLPSEVETLLSVIEIKRSCKVAHVEKVDVGPKGLVVSFHNNVFPNPTGLVALIQNPQVGAKLRPDHKVVFMRQWENLAQRRRVTKQIIERLAQLASQA